MRECKICIRASFVQHSRIIRAAFAQLNDIRASFVHLCANAARTITALPTARPPADIPSVRVFRRLPDVVQPTHASDPRIDRMLTCLRAVEDSLIMLDMHHTGMDAAMWGGGDVQLISGGFVDVGGYGQSPRWVLSGISIAGWEERVRKAMMRKNILVGANLDEDTCFALVFETLARILGDIWFHAPVRALTKIVDKAWYYHYTFGRGSVHEVLYSPELQSLFWPSTSGESMGFKKLDLWVSFFVHGHPRDDVWKPYLSALEQNANPRSVPLLRVEQAAEDVLEEMHGEWAR
ncbi:hypothetical protein EXIGLDRAFT_766319 [Exidia glandulosa HHB12029]|uniref:Uncharacterized protein n=1 Tax=Exidia glandulosa HHB12029 TaxID=1314781 RepID=A0A165JTF8_EXIGL|nr:hypothetical protein EXIGLDRAFT_766319 [Exidia glandulosa HHB12029]